MASQTPGDAPTVAASSVTTERYGWYVVFVLMLAYTLSFIDRQILSLLVQPIKSELDISDTQVGLLQGFAFALFYTVLGLPMGRIVDRYSRKNLIAVGVALWSLMTVLCGVARGFGALFVARMGVGIGEATLSPAALSMITDCFRSGRLGTALSIYSLGIFIGAGTAFMIGGAVIAAVASMASVTLPLAGTLAPWRLAFFVVGIPGLLLAILIYQLREPSRTGVILTVDGTSAQLSVRQVMQQLRRRQRSFIGIALLMACHAICMYAVFAWTPTFFVRSFGWTAATAGMTLGAIVLLAGCGGMLTGGWLCDRWQAAGRADAPLRVGLLGALLAGGGGLFCMTSVDASRAVVGLIPLVVGLALPIGSVFAALQLIFPNQVRGQISALFLFVISLIGITLGPLLPGVLNDRVFLSDASIGQSLAITISTAAALMGIVARITFSSYASDHRALRQIIAQE
ncbi:MAG TPA: MFS transporter [Steroidobacteraceae bacterium]|nr:MFS transporter [Steroidobacteraceae bacterium]HRX87914.1 MFS transporter [Steroidobacteraceae bacterium]